MVGCIVASAQLGVLEPIRFDGFGSLYSAEPDKFGAGVVDARSDAEGAEG